MIAKPAHLVQIPEPVVPLDGACKQEPKAAHAHGPGIVVPVSTPCCLLSNCISHSESQGSCQRPMRRHERSLEGEDANSLLHHNPTRERKGHDSRETQRKELLTTRCRKELTGVRGFPLDPKLPLHIYVNIVISCKGRTSQGSP